MTVCSFHDKSQTSWVRCLGSLLVQAPPCPTLVTGSRESLKVAESRHSPHSNGKMSAIKSFIVLLVVRINQTSRGGRTWGSRCMGSFHEHFIVETGGIFIRGCEFSGLPWKFCFFIILCLYFTTVIWPEGMFPHFWHIAQLLLSCRYCSISNHIIHIKLNIMLVTKEPP